MKDDGRCRDAGMNRREFLRRSVAAGTALAAGSALAATDTDSGPLPTRVLGRTGEKVTILGLGTAPIGEGPVETKQAARIFAEVMDRGVNYIDTARIYGNAEEALGRVLSKRRDRLFLVTKVWTDSADRAEKILSTSLRKLNVDYVDLCHIHHVGGKKVDRVLSKDGVLPYLLKQKEKGKIRFVGVSGHCRPDRFVRVIKTGEIDVVMPVMNYADRNIYNFEGRVLPECRRRNLGVVAMKVYAGIEGGFPYHRKGYVGCATPHEKLPQAMAYALDLPGVHVANVGPYTMEQALENVKFAQNYEPLSDAQRESLLAYGRELAADLGERYGPAEAQS